MQIGSSRRNRVGLEIDGIRLFRRSSAANNNNSDSVASARRGKNSSNMKGTKKMVEWSLSPVAAARADNGTKWGAIG